MALRPGHGGPPNGGSLKLRGPPSLGLASGPRPLLSLPTNLSPAGTHLLRRATEDYARIVMAIVGQDTLGSDALVLPEGKKQQDIPAVVTLPVVKPAPEAQVVARPPVSQPAAEVQIPVQPPANPAADMQVKARPPVAPPALAPGAVALPVRPSAMPSATPGTIRLVKWCGKESEQLAPPLDGRSANGCGVENQVCAMQEACPAPAPAPAWGNLVPASGPAAAPDPTCGNLAPGSGTAAAPAPACGNLMPGSGPAAAPALACGNLAPGSGPKPAPTPVCGNLAPRSDHALAPTPGCGNLAPDGQSVSQRPPGSWVPAVAPGATRPQAGSATPPMSVPSQPAGPHGATPLLLRGAEVQKLAPPRPPDASGATTPQPGSAALLTLAPPRPPDAPGITVPHPAGDSFRVVRPRRPVDTASGPGPPLPPPDSAALPMMPPPPPPDADGGPGPQGSSKTAQCWALVTVEELPPMVALQPPALPAPQPPALPPPQPPALPPPQPPAFPPPQPPAVLPQSQPPALPPPQPPAQPRPHPPVMPPPQRLLDAAQQVAVQSQRQDPQKVLDRIHNKLYKSVRWAVTPIAHLDPKWQETEITKRIVKYIYKAVNWQGMQKMPWKGVCTELVENALHGGYTAACSSRPWFSKIDLVPVLCEAAYELLSSSGRQPVPDPAQVWETVHRSVEKCLGHVMRDQAMWDACGAVFKDYKVQSKLFTSVSKISQQLVQEVAAASHPVSDVAHLEAFTRQWIEETLNRAWCSLDSPSTVLTEELVTKLFQRLVTPTGEDGVCCLPHVLTEHTGPPPREWPFIGAAVKEWFTTWASAPPASFRARVTGAAGGVNPAARARIEWCRPPGSTSEPDWCRPGGPEPQRRPLSSRSHRRGSCRRGRSGSRRLCSRSRSGCGHSRSGGGRRGRGRSIRRCRRSSSSSRRSRSRSLRRGRGSPRGRPGSGHGPWTSPSRSRAGSNAASAANWLLEQLEQDQKCEGSPKKGAPAVDAEPPAVGPCVEASALEDHRLATLSDVRTPAIQDGKAVNADDGKATALGDRTPMAVECGTVAAIMDAKPMGIEDWKSMALERSQDGRIAAEDGRPSAAPEYERSAPMAPEEPKAPEGAAPQVPGVELPDGAARHGGG